MIARAALLSLIAVTTGCMSTTKRMNDISLGMTKGDVIEAIGKPDETRAVDGVEYMLYELKKAPGAGTQTACGVAGVLTFGIAYINPGCQSERVEHFVQLRDGKVTSYGRPGDFNSTKTPESTLNINQRVENVPAQ